MRKGRYLIIENRRPYGFDLDVGSNCNGEQTAPTTGGFLVWEFDDRLVDPNAHRGGLTLIEANTNNNVKYDQWKLTSSEDFFDHSQTLAVWTQPGIVCAKPSSVIADSTFHPAPEVTGRPAMFVFQDYDSTQERNSFYLDLKQPYTNNAYAQCCNNQNKLAFSGDTLALTTAARLNDESGKGLIVTYLSGDGGATWSRFVLNSSLSMMDDSSFAPGTDNDASAPSIAWSGSSFHLVWQEKRPDSIYLIRTSTLYGTVHTLDTVSCSGEGPLPVIGARLTNTVKVYYSTDSGIIERVSCDGGVSWPDTLKREAAEDARLYDALSQERYAGTSAISVRPSFTMGADHDVLVWQEAVSDTGSVLFIRKKYGSTIDLYRLSDYSIDTLRNMRHPHVAVADEYIQLVWIGTKVEEMGQKRETHHKSAHLLWNIQESQWNLNVKTFFNRKYNRFEASADPVIIPKPGEPGNDPSAFLMWSVDDSVSEGARLRGNLLCRRGTAYGWGKDMEMPGFSSFITRSPQLALLDDGVSFVIVKGDSAPYHLRSNGADRYRWDPNLQEYAEYEYYIADEASRRIMSSFVLHTPVVTDSILTQFDVQVIGPPLGGYDGSPGGAGIRDITRTFPFIFRSSDVVNWELNYRQSPIFTTRDTIHIRGIIIDSATAQEIGSSGEYLVLPVCNDTTFALGFELPPSYYPEAKTHLCIEVSGGAIEEPSRRLSSMINILSDESAGKRRAESAIRDGSAAPLSIQAYPQPSNNQITINIRGLRGNDFTLELFDALGRRVHDHNFCHSASGAGHVQLDTRYFRSGVYYFSIKSSAAIRYGKFIVSR